MVAVNALWFYFDPNQYRDRFDVEEVAPKEFLLTLKKP